MTSTSFLAPKYDMNLHNMVYGTIYANSKSTSAANVRVGQRGFTSACFRANLKDLNSLRVQITDISQFGTLAEVAGLVLPRDVVMLSSVTTQLTLPPKDTGTVRGIVERAPQTIYRWLRLNPLLQRQGNTCRKKGWGIISRELGMVLLTGLQNRR